MELNARIPTGPIAEKWDKHRFELKLVNPANKRKYRVIVVGSGLAGASAAASQRELSSAKSGRGASWAASGLRNRRDGRTCRMAGSKRAAATSVLNERNIAGIHRRPLSSATVFCSGSKDAMRSLIQSAPTGM